MIKTGVYWIQNRLNGIIYIGSTARTGFDKRKLEHWRLLQKGKHPNPHLQNAWYKYGADVFVFEILLYCNPENCLMYEQITLDHYKPGYNIALDAKAPMLGRKHSRETRDRISQSNRGKHSASLSQEHKDRISHTLSGDGNPMYGLRGADHPAYGRIHSEDELHKMSEARKGSKHPLACLDEDRVRRIKMLIHMGESCQTIANKFNVGRTTIGEIKAGRNWSHVL